MYVKSVPIVQFSNTQSTSGSGSFNSNDMYIKHRHNMSNINSINNDSIDITNTCMSNNNFPNNKINTSSKVVQELNMHICLSCDIQARKRR